MMPQDESVTTATGVLQLTIQQLPLAAAVIGREGELLSVNEQYLALLGSPAANSPLVDQIAHRLNVEESELAALRAIIRQGKSTGSAGVHLAIPDVLENASTLIVGIGSWVNDLAVVTIQKENLLSSYGLSDETGGELPGSPMARSLMDVLPNGLIIMDLKEDGQLYLRKWNFAAELILSADYNLKTNVPITEVFPGIEHHPLFRGLVEAAENGVSSRLNNLSMTNAKRYYESTVFQIATRRIGLLFTEISDLLDAKGHLQKLSLVVEESSAEVMITDVNGIIEYANPSAARMTGYSIDELIGMDIIRFSEVNTGREDFLRLREALEAGHQWSGEFTSTRRDGVQLIINGSVYSLHNHHGEMTHFVFVGEDVTEQRNTMRALKESEEKFRNFFDNAQIGLFQTSVENSKLLFANDKMAELFGYANAEEAIEKGYSVEHYKNPEDRVAFTQKIKEEGFVDGVEIESRRVDGSTGWILYSARINHHSGVYEGTALDITQWKDAQQKLLKSESRFRGMFEQAFAPILIFNMVDVFLANPGFERLFGYTLDELTSESFDLENLFEADAWLEIRNESESLGESESSFHTTARTITAIGKDGKPLQLFMNTSRFEWDGQPALLASFQDVTQVRALEEQLHQAQKMEAIGRLAGGVAHDFNNLLTGLIGHAEMAMLELDEEHPAQRDLQDILSISDRSTDLVRQLLTFSRKQEVLPKVVNVNKAVSDADRLLHRIIGEGYTLATRYGSKLEHFLIDQGQLEQILVNMVVNAADAMGGKGTIQIETRDVALHPNKKTGKGRPTHVQLIVRDTGHGMDDEVKARIFEPFFTTKAEGRGTGLGLATVFGIVQQHDGIIEVDSAPGKGTEFRISFPGVNRASTNDEPSNEGEIATGKETILVVEDEETVLDLAVRTLRQKGYTVLEAMNTEEAIQLAKAYGDKIDLMLSDVVMPGINGPEVYKIVHQFQPTMKVLYMSGYSKDVIDAEQVKGLRESYLQKPFRQDSLLRQVRLVLDRSKRA